MTVRTLVTGHNAKGQAVFTADQNLAATTVALMPGVGFHMLWSTAVTPAFPDAGQHIPSPTYFPAPTGARFLIFTIPAERTPPPPGTDMTRALADAKQTLPGLLETMEADNPGMHRSPTQDYVYVLEGEVVLELDEGQEKTLRMGDAVIQNGTRHAWRNRSGQAVKLLVVMMGSLESTTPPHSNN
jgi:mannose-6-phosphate isomerase-like protein (cupin superfamily)